jgi:hypothetical protein
LSKLDHVGVVFQCLGKIYHSISCVLLFTGPWRSKERAKRRDCNRAALLATTGFVASGLPFCGGVGNDLRNSFIEWHCVNRGCGQGESDDGGQVNHFD